MLLHPLLRIQTCAFLTKLEMKDVTSIGILTNGSECVFGLDVLAFADRDGRET